ncbi:PH domain-containing protein [Candidatus Parabeggiatoa sp. HSG14]|uniref:PH domain-containing protein n=1 Tax=Candidatus Parabeggiatoa sp. HSG14 TaxID=3055593 RepID=UPI0025A72551|nr:PH domain-containing protein [Thiotrichales bacterium HSG14]
MKKNLYELLEVSPKATQQQIRMAMTRIAKLSTTNGRANEIIPQIKEAYKILSDPYQRANYDNSLNHNEKDKKDDKKYSLNYFIKWIVKIAKICKLQIINFWQLSKEWSIKRWQINKQLFIEKWQIGKQQIIKGFQFCKQLIRKNKINKQIVQESKTNASQHSKKVKEVNEDLAIKSWKIVKQHAATRYVNNALVPGEKIVYQTCIHWFFYLDFGAVFLVILSSFLLIFKPPFIGDGMPAMLLWIPWFGSGNLLETPVWRLGLITLLFIGLMMLWEAFIIKHTTELVITSKRMLSRCGFLNKTITELKLKRFESITIVQSLLGVIFNYGTITITGMGGVKTVVHNVVAPLRFRKILWESLEEIEQCENENW